MLPPIHAIRDRLLQGLDKDYNVVDMGIVVEVISQLENYAITKEALEATRLGRHINELRRKATDKQLASRAKSLVKKWRELLMPVGNSGTATPVQTMMTSKEAPKMAAAVSQRLNGHSTSQPSSRLTSPAVSSSSRLSPGIHNNNNNRGPSSSMPSSASSSPGISRPTTPNHVNSRPVSPAAVPKTNAANKRLRKDDEDDLMPSAKRTKGLETTPVMNGTNCDKTNGVHHNNESKQSNKKVSKKKQLEQEREHLLEQKLLTARASKVRTTQELVEELALRSTTPTTLKSSSSSGSIANETKTELMNRFFESQSNGHSHSDVLSPPLSDGPSSPNSSLPKEVLPPTKSEDEEKITCTVEDILAQLPPIDAASVLAEINSEMQQESEDEEEIEGLIPPVKQTKEELSDGVKAKLVEELHQGQHESVNGNFNHDGAFKEWHQVVTKETVNGDLLYILPYSVID